MQNNTGAGCDCLADELLFPREAADFLKVSDRTLQTWRRRKVGPPYFKAAGGSVRYPRSGLADFVRRSTYPGKPVFSDDPDE